MLLLILMNAFIQVRFNFNRMMSRGYRLIVNDGEPCPYPLVTAPSYRTIIQELLFSFASVVRMHSCPVDVTFMDDFVVLSVVSISTVLHAPVSSIS